MTKRFDNENFAYRAWYERLSAEEVKSAPIEKLSETHLGYTVLYMAAGFCSAEVVEVLLQRGLDINGLSTRNHTPLTGSAINGNWDATRLLLAKGADVSLVLENKQTALHCAAEQGAPSEIVLTLVNAGIDPLILDDKGNTAFMIATQHRKQETAKCLEQFTFPSKSAKFLA
jgi:ankyrin repeat protein